MHVLQTEYHSQGWRMSLEFLLLQKCKCEVFYFILEVVMGTWWDTRKTSGFGKMKIYLVFMLVFDFWTSEEFWLSLKNEVMIILGLSLQIIVLHSLHTQPPSFWWDHWEFLVHKECNITFQRKVWTKPLWDFTPFVKPFVLVSTQYLNSLLPWCSLFMKNASRFICTVEHFQ